MCSYPDAIDNALNDLSEHYTDVAPIKKGQNGYVFLARNRISNSDVAIKFYAGEPGARQHSEPQLLSRIRSDNVIRIYDARAIQDGWAYFITERGSGGDLEDLTRGNPSVHRSLTLLSGICAGVSAIHAAGMIHRDLKPENIVIKSGVPLIADFGSVRELAHGQETVRASRHSILFRPPESFGTNLYSIKGDIYQIGLVAYKLFGGSLPYEETHYLNTRDRQAFDSIEDSVDRSIFVDGIIRAKSERGKIADLATLPPWFTNSAKRKIKKILHHQPDNRVNSLSNVVAILSNIRTETADWFWNNGVPRLMENNSVVEIREIRRNVFAAFRDRGAGFRKIPNSVTGHMSDVIANLPV